MQVAITVKQLTKPQLHTVPSGVFVVFV